MARARSSTKGATRRQAKPRQGKPVATAQAKTTARARGPGGRFISKAEIARLEALERRRERDRARRAEARRAEEKRIAALEARRRRDRARRAEEKRAREEAERIARERLEKKRERDRERKREKRAAEKKRREALEKRRERDRARRAEAKRAREEIERKRLEELEKKRQRSEAAKEGWRKRKLLEEQKRRAREEREAEKVRRKLEEEAEKLRRQKVDASAGLEALFKHPKWFDSSWVAFADGTIEGILVVVAGDPSVAFEHLSDLESDVSEVIRKEKVWVQVGVTFIVKDVDEGEEEAGRYEDFRGTDTIWSYPRRGQNVASVFMAMSANHAGPRGRGILANILAKGYKPLTFLVRVVSGIKPSES